MKVFPRIVIAVAAVAVLNILPVCIQINHGDKIHENLNLIMQSNLREQEGISQLAYYLQRTKSNIRELLLELSSRPQSAEIANAVTVVRESLLKMHENALLLQDATMIGKELGSYSEQKASNLEIKKADKIVALVKKFITLSEEIVAVAANRDDVKYYLGLFVSSVEPVSRDLQEQIEEFKLEEFDEVRHEIAEIAEHAEGMKKDVLLASLLTFVLSLLIAVWVAKSTSSNQH